MTRRREEGRAPSAFPDDLPALTSVRFVLALGVVLFHYQLQWSWPTADVTGLLERARLGVDIFFILSGFVLTHAYRRDLDQRRLDYGRFLVARFARIYPAHLAVLAFVLTMVIAANALGAEFDRELYNPAGLATTLMLVHAWSPAVITAEWNGPSWSLSAEWFAYLSFPVFAWIGVRLRTRLVWLFALVAAIFLALDQLYQGLFNDTVVHAEANLGVLRIIPEFLYGVALYRLGERLTWRPETAAAFAAASATMVVLLMHFEADDRLIVAAAGPLVLALALLAKAGADGPLSHPWMLASGEASYALYLVHFPLMIGWKGVVSALTGASSSYVLAGWEIPSLLAITLIAAFALHYLVERPARRWIRRMADRRWPKFATRSAMTPGSQPPDL